MELSAVSLSHPSYTPPKKALFIPAYPVGLSVAMGMRPSNKTVFSLRRVMFCFFAALLALTGCSERPPTGESKPSTIIPSQEPSLDFIASGNFENIDLTVLRPPLIDSLRSQQTDLSLNSLLTYIQESDAKLYDPQDRALAIRLIVGLTLNNSQLKKTQSKKVINALKKAFKFKLDEDQTVFDNYMTAALQYIESQNHTPFKIEQKKFDLLFILEPADFLPAN